jgi:hypothetical protein
MQGLIPEQLMACSGVSTSPHQLMHPNVLHHHIARLLLYVLMLSITTLLITASMNLQVGGCFNRF